jgi:hypothetical protein
VGFDPRFTDIHSRVANRKELMLLSNRGLGSTLRIKSC